MRPVVCTLVSRRASHAADTAGRPEKRSVCPRHPRSSSRGPQYHPRGLGLLCLWGRIFPDKPHQTWRSSLPTETSLV